MRLLLDTHVLISLARRELNSLNPDLSAALRSSENALFVSAASTWEIAIKSRLGKLDPGIPLGDLGAYFESIGLALLQITHAHAVQQVEPEPATRDPFDRMLLAQCSAEDLRLVTLDRGISNHPLAWQPA